MASVVAVPRMPIRLGVDALTAKVLGGSIDDVQDREPGCGAHALDPGVGGVAGHGNGTASGRLEPSDAAEQGGQGIFCALDAREQPGRYPRVGPENGRDVVLVAGGRGKECEAQHELRAGERAHAAEHSQDAICHGLRLTMAAWGGKTGP